MNIWHQFVDYFRTALTAIADFYSFLGGHRWAAAIITLTIIVRTLLLPLAIKQIRSMREQQRLRPRSRACVRSTAATARSWGRKRWRCISARA